VDPGTIEPVSEAPTEAFGPYLVYEQLGVGGMAQVHRATVEGIEGFVRPVALKRMLPHVAANEDMVKAFVREARLASYLRHVNVAQTYELGKVGDIYFIAMELVTGRTLRAVLRHCGSTTGPMPAQIALNILNQLCDALDYAHNLCDEAGQPLGIIHRDVSPSNIIVAEGGVVKLIDFGIAKASARGMQTQSGTIKGKFGYMAPEYIAGSIDARADLFALGVIAHELLTNTPLFTGDDDMQTLQRVRTMEIEPPSHRNPLVPAEIDDIVMTALARDPERRWQHATALRTAMTTLTKRLGLAVHNGQVIEWLDWAFDQTKPRGERIRRSSQQVNPDESSSLAPPPSAATSQNITLVLTGEAPAPPHQTPAGTSRAIIAQAAVPPPSAAPAPTPLASAEYQAALAEYHRASSSDASPTFGGARSNAERCGESINEALPTVPGTRSSGLRPRTASQSINATLIDGAVGPSKRFSAPSVVAPLPPSEPQRLAPPAPARPAAPRSASWVVVLVLLAAAAVAAGVYFALPYVTQ
jgi:eukaryotic-like serine/threonine-protein kinase